MNVYGELTRAQLQLSASDLTPTATGLTYFNTSTGVKWYNGSAWLTAADTSTSQVFTNKDYDGGTASNTSRFTLPKASTSTLNALTRKEATLVFDTTTSQVKYDNGTSLLAVGSSSGAGEINAVLNPSVADTTTGWTNGTSHTLTRVTSGSPLDPVITTALSIAATTTATESATSGEYYSISSLASGLRNKKLKIEFYFTTEASQTWAVSVWQGSTRKALSTDASGASTLPAGTTGKFTAYIDTDSSDAYTVNFTRTAGSGTATLLVTSVILGPGIQPQGSVVGSVNQFATTIGGLGSGSVVSLTTDFFYYRVGENMVAWGAFTKDGTAGTGAADVTMTMPSGLTINTSYLTESSSVASQINRLGPWNIRNASGKYGHVNPASTTTLRFSRQDTGSSDLAGADVGAGAVLAFGPLVIPISEWSGSGTVNLAQNDVEAIYSNATTTTAGASDLTSFGYGPQGVAFNAINSTTTSSVTTYRVRAMRPIGPLDTAIIQTSRDRNIWNIVGQDGSVAPATAANTANYGMSLLYVSGSTTDIDVIFGNNGRIPGSTYGGNGTAWSGVTSLYWRVLIVRGGTVSGIGNVSENSSGFMPSNHSNLDNAAATRLGLKEYLHGTTYNGGNAPTITGQAGFAADTRCVFIPYQMQSGTWRMRFNVRFSQTSGTTADISIAGVTFNKVAPVLLSGNNLASASYAGRTTDASGSIVLRASSADTTFSASGDVELTGKPNWAY